MSFRSYVRDRAYDLSLGQTQRNYCREVLQNDGIPFGSENGDEILSAVKKCYPEDSALRVFIRRMWVAYQHEIEKATNSVESASGILKEVFDHAECYKENGDLHDQFRQRPDLYLLAVIASGLFEIADAIRETK